MSEAERQQEQQALLEQLYQVKGLVPKQLNRAVRQAEQLLLNLDAPSMDTEPMDEACQNALEQLQAYVDEIKDLVQQGQAMRLGGPS